MLLFFSFRVCLFQFDFLPNSIRTKSSRDFSVGTPARQTQQPIPTNRDGRVKKMKEEIFHKAVQKALINIDQKEKSSFDSLFNRLISSGEVHGHHLTAKQR